MGGLAQVSAEIAADQPLASAGASRSSSIGLLTPVSWSFNNEMEKPRPLSDVMYVPARIRTGLMPWPDSSCDRTSVVMPPISSTLTPPRLLTNNTNLSDSLADMNARSLSDWSSMYLSIVLTIPGRSAVVFSEPGSL